MRRGHSASTRRCPLTEAFRRCPHGVFLPVDGRRYQQASRDVMAILRRFTPQVEPISIDEAFLDVTGSRPLFGDGPAIARGDQGGGAGRGRADGVGRRRDDEARRQDRVRPAQARRPRRRPGRRGGGVPRAAPDLAAVGRRREDGDGPRANTASRRSATWRRCRPICSCGGSGSTARRSGRARWAWTTTPSTRATPRSRSATSTRSTSTRSDPEVIERTLLAHEPRGSPGACGPPASEHRRSR